MQSKAWVLDRAVVLTFLCLLSLGSARAWADPPPAVAATSAPASTRAEHWHSLGISYEKFLGPLLTTTNCEGSFEKFLGCVAAVQASLDFVVPPLHLAPGSGGDAADVTHFEPVHTEKDALASASATQSFAAQWTALRTRQQTEVAAWRTLWESRDKVHVPFSDLKAWVQKQVVGALGTQEAAIAAASYNAYLKNSTQSRAELVPLSYMKQLNAAWENELTPAEEKKMGLGFSVSRILGRYVVTAMSPGGAAAVDLARKVSDNKKKVHVNDVLLAVGDEDVTNMDPSELRQRLRGEPGDSVSLKLQRADETETFEVLLNFQESRATVLSRIQDDIGVVRIIKFDTRFDPAKKGSTCQTVAATLRSWEQQKLVRALLLDLRDVQFREDLGADSEAEMSQAYCVANLFLKAGLVMGGRKLLIDDTLPDQIFRSTVLPVASAVPLVVLINAQSSFGAEALAGALQIQQRALLVGERSQGQGTLESWVGKLKGNSILGGKALYKKALLRLSLPSEKNSAVLGPTFTFSGIQPDVEITRSVAPSAAESLAFRYEDSFLNPPRERAVAALSSRLEETKSSVTKHSACVQEAASRLESDSEHDYQGGVALQWARCLLSGTS